MINFYYGYSLIWSFILVLYAFGFSDLCKQLDNNLLIFIVFTIIVSFFIGYIQKDKFKYIVLKENPHTSKKITILFCVFIVSEFLLERKIPLLSVISGQAYNTINYSGFKGFHMIFFVLSIVYSFYLSYLYSLFRKKNLLIENIIIIMYFVLLVQRQNIIICVLGFVAFLFFSVRDRKKDIKLNNNCDTGKKKGLIKKLSIVLFIIIILYGFGVMGNFRYGSSWKWNDTSMIETLGKMNEKYPNYVPKQFFWSYLYLVSPLVNLNANIEYYNNSIPSISNYLNEFIPEYVRNKVGYSKDVVYLPVTSLNASTSYVRSYKYMGYFGMYFMFLIYMVISTFILNIGYKKNQNFHMVNCFSISYIILFTFFENTLTYSTTSIILIISFIMSFKYKYK